MKIILSFAVVIYIYAPCVLAADTNPPTPDPATFATVPTAIGENEIFMSATLGTDPNTPIEYYFACVAGGGNDRTWSIDPNFTDSGLSPVTQYTYTVQMRDAIGNTGTESSQQNATTLDTTPPTPSTAVFATGPTAISETEITMSASGTDLSGPVEYYFACVGGGGNDRGWQTTSDYTDSGLDPVTQYTYTVQMRDAIGNTGTESSQQNATTLDTTPPSPVTAAFITGPTAISETEITMTAATGSDLFNEPVEYRFLETTGGPGATSSNWQTTSDYTDSGLDPVTQYTYTVQMRDAIGNTGTASSPQSATTPDTTPPTPSPAVFATGPTAISATEITMSAAGTDLSGPVEYYFACVGGAGNDRGWQTTSDYTDSGLDPVTQYTYTVQMRDAIGNTGTESSQQSATTLDTHAISGYILDAFDGTPVADVLVSASVGGGAGVTASDGYYSVLVPEGWNGSVTPTKTGSYYHQFTPDERTYSNVTSNLANEDYDADRLGPYNINYFTELFESADNDLSYKMFTFLPGDSTSYYLLCVDDITDFPTDPSGSATLSLTDNNFQQIDLVGGLKVKLYGQSYGSFMVGSNGYITFDSGDTNELESVIEHFSQKRISGLFIDLNPPASGTVSWEQLSDRAVVTFENVSEQGVANSNNFQIEMFFDGTIVLSYLNIDAQYGLAGLSAGYGKPTDYAERALSGYHICADIDADYTVGPADIAAMAEYWLDPACQDSVECRVADLDRSGQIDMTDLSYLAEYWLDEKPLPPPLTIEEIFYSQAENDGRMWGNDSGVIDIRALLQFTGKALMMGCKPGVGYRSVVSFDTTSLPDNCTISSAALKLTCGYVLRDTPDPFAPGSWAGPSYIDIVAPSFGSIELEDADWDAAADAYDVATFDITESPALLEPMTSTDFNIAGLTNISKTGTTQLKFGFANLYGAETSYRGFYSGEDGGDKRPQLIIQYLITPPQ